MEAWWRISAISTVGFSFRSYCVRPSSQFAHYINLCYHYYIKKNAKFYMKFYDSCCFRYFSRIGIFRTEKFRTILRCGRGFFADSECEALAKSVEMGTTAIPLALDGGLKITGSRVCAILALWNVKSKNRHKYLFTVSYSYASIERNC